MILIPQNSDWLENRSKSNGSLEALYFKDRGYTYDEFNNYSLKYASYYFRHGVSKNSRVIISTESLFEFAVSIFAIWKIGAIPIPLYHDLPESEIRAITKQSNSERVIVRQDKRRAFPELESILIPLPEADKTDEEPIPSTAKFSSEDTAVIIYTSGSSGKPKGVKLTFSNLYHSARGCDSVANFEEKEKFLVSLPPHHVGGFSIIIRSILCAGDLILPDSINSQTVIDALITYRPQYISLVPTMLYRILKMNIDPYPSLKGIFLGGGPIDADMVGSALRKGWPVINVYGSTETSSMVAAIAGEDIKKFPGSSGRPLIDNKIRIVDDEFNPLPANTSGEIIVRSESVSPGYLDDDSSNQMKFIDGYYLTGDIGFLDEIGNLFVEKRKDDLIVTGGLKISRSEIENKISRIDGVLDSAVMKIKDAEWGEKIIAAVVLNPETLSQADFERLIAIKLPGFKKPKAIYYVNEIPRGGLAKLRKDELLTMLGLNDD